MTDFSISADMTVKGLLPSLCSADIHDVLAACINELNRRGGEVELRPGSVMTQWAEITPRGGDYSAVYHDICYAEAASGEYGKTWLEDGDDA